MAGVFGLSDFRVEQLEGNIKVNAANDFEEIFTANDWNEWNEEKQQNVLMDYRLTAEDKERINLLNEVQKNKFSSLSLEQLIRLQELVEKKDYSHEKKANKSKTKLLNQINIEIYKRDDSAIWK